jgi:hypothetical protein
MRYYLAIIGTSAASLVVCVAVFMLFMALGPAQAHRVSLGEIQRSGAHWCNWSITSTCTRWRANGGKSYGLGCTGPNDMRSGCRARNMR